MKDGQIFTPVVRGEESPGGLPSPVLPGVTRAEVLDCARRLGIETTSRMLTIDDVLKADELMLTNSSLGHSARGASRRRTSLAAKSARSRRSARRTGLLKAISRNHSPRGLIRARGELSPGMLSLHSRAEGFDALGSRRWRPV